MTDFHDLYNKYAPDIYRFALYLCGDRTEAEEITAETFAKALTVKVPLESFTVKAYLFRITRNLHLESIRYQKRFSDLPSELLDSGTDSESIIDHKIELESVYSYLQLFPEIDRTALLLRADGLSYLEIMKILNISLASAKVKVHRIRQKLAEWRLNNH